jgi:hypothetical protein
VCFAIGSTTADSLREQTSNKIIPAGMPTQESLLSAVISYVELNALPGSQHGTINISNESTEE